MSGHISGSLADISALFFTTRRIASTAFSMNISLTRKNVSFFLISTFISTSAIWYFFSRLSVHQIIEVFQNLSLQPLLAFFILSLSGSLMRTWRYQKVLQLTGQRVHTLPLFLITLVRNFCADLLPARLGTLVYIYLATQRLGATLSSASLSFLLALLLDLISLVPLLMIFVALSLFNPLGGLSLLPALLILAATLLPIAMILWLHDLVALLKRLIQCIAFGSEKIQSRLLPLLHALESDILKIQSKRVLGELFVYSLGIRLAKYGSLIVFLYALLYPLGYTHRDVTISYAFFGIFLSEIAASLPASGIGGFGLYEGTWATVFRIVGLPGTIADVTAVSHHLFTQTYGYLLGITALIALLLMPGFDPSRESRPLLSFQYRVVLILILFSGAFSLTQNSNFAIGAHSPANRTSP
ncbi:MAG: flippase-like domain-containing protein [Bdellovibrionales bacterium]|nr:flippase-like domain-containing protein [Bdellovibrionales bacterium]